MKSKRRAKASDMAKDAQTGVPIYSRRAQDWIVAAANEVEREKLAKDHPHIPVFTHFELALLKGTPVDVLQVVISAKKTFGSSCTVLGIKPK